MKQKSILEQEFEMLFRYVADISVAIGYLPKFREFYVNRFTGPERTVGNSIIRISFCPFTGKKLPEDLRDEWFDQLDKLGLEDPWGDDEDKVPKEFHSEEWWIKRGH